MVFNALGAVRPVEATTALAKPNVTQRATPHSINRGDATGATGFARASGVSADISSLLAPPGTPGNRKPFALAEASETGQIEETRGNASMYDVTNRGQAIQSQSWSVANS